MFTRKSHAGLKFNFGQNDQYEIHTALSSSHFASIDMNTSKELTEHRREIFNRNEISY